MLLPDDVCSGFANWESSDYILPYPVGTAYAVEQANCSGQGHSGFWKYGYDFTMAIGTLVTASRAGRVLYKQELAFDGDGLRTNLVTIEHADGTVAAYVHLTRLGALVESGQFVTAGEPVGLSGNTGLTAGRPHLHFSLHTCGGLPGLPDEGNCPSLPVTFRNTDANPNGLLVGRTYLAGPV